MKLKFKKINFKKINLKNKKIVICGIVLILIILLVLGIIVSNKNKTKNTLNSYNNTMNELAKIFYEEHYYDLIVNSNGKEYLSKFSETGIDVDLNTLGNISSKTRKLAEKLVNIDTKESCDKAKTKVNIKSKEPYERGDYSVDVTLECGFNN